jgi:hypothetical protein
LFDLIGELSAEFAPDPPCQATLAGAAFREDDRKISGNVDVLGDYLDATGRYVRDRAVAWQGAGSELDLREPSAYTAFACTTIG